MKSTRCSALSETILFVNRELNTKNSIKQQQSCHVVGSTNECFDDCEALGSTNQCLCVPKAELNTKNSTKRQSYASFS